MIGVLNFSRRVWGCLDRRLSAWRFPGRASERQKKLKVEMIRQKDGGQDKHGRTVDSLQKRLELEGPGGHSGRDRHGRVSAAQGDNQHTLR